MVPEWFYMLLGGTLASLPPLLAFSVWYTSRKSLERDEVVRTLRARVESLESERRELQAKIAELEARLKDSEARCLEEMKRRDAECNARLRQLEEACEIKVREASRLSSTARTLFEAFRAGVVEPLIKGEECDEIEVQPGKILCCRDNECRVVYPERSQPGEEVIIRKRTGRKRQSKPRREASRPEAAPNEEEAMPEEAEV